MSDREKKPAPLPTPIEMLAMSTNMAVELLDGALAEWESPSDQRVWLQAYHAAGSVTSSLTPATYADICLEEYRKRFPKDEAPNLKGSNPREDDDE